MSTAETVFAILISASSAAGLLLVSRILEGPEKRRRQLFVYYTNLSNLAMLVTHVLLLFPGRGRELLRSPAGRYVTTLCILVTFVVYFFVLTHFGRPRSDLLRSLGVRRVSNFLVHYLVPALTVLEWLCVADKRGLGLRDAVLWLAVPLAYFVFLLLRARTGAVITAVGRLWPYGFLDPDILGTRRWLRNLAATLVGFFILGLLLLGIGRVLI